MSVIIKKITSLLIGFFCLFIFTVSLSENGTGIELHGRVYDGKPAKAGTSINDADLEITISGISPDINYPIDSQGSYRVVEFNVPIERNIYIQAFHHDYIQPENINFQTTSFRRRQDIRMIRKNVFAEDNYYKATEIRQNTVEKIDEAFSLGKLSVKISPSPHSRYYLFLADTIGNRIKSMAKNDELPSNMVDFIESIPEDQAFRNFPKNEKKKFYIKMGINFSKCKNLSSELTVGISCLQYSKDAFDEAIKLFPDEASPYQGKYLVLTKSKNYLDAINVIDKYFEENNNIRSELTIKGFLSSWVGLIRDHTDFMGSNEEIENQRSNMQNRNLWRSLHERLEQYRNYYQNPKIKGNRNLQKAYKNSRRIISDG